jgi:hypothetical protein
MGAELILHVIRPPDATGLSDIAESRVESTPAQHMYACRLLTAVVAARKEVGNHTFWCCLCSAPVQTTVGITVCAVTLDDKPWSLSVVCDDCTDRFTVDELYEQCGDSFSQDWLERRGTSFVHEAGHA